MIAIDAPVRRDTKKRKRSKKNSLQKRRDRQAQRHQEAGDILEETIQSLRESDRPIIVGPWLSEIGFEILYWIPFIAWIQKEVDLAPDRFVIVSRGGAGAWYRNISGRYFDILSVWSADEFRRKNEERSAAQGGGQKHVTVGAFDQKILNHVQGALGLTEVDLLHPSLMYNYFRGGFRARTVGPFSEIPLRFRRFSPLSFDPMSLSLPSEYVAVKFYHNNSFPDVPENREFVRTVLAQLTRSSDVVILDPGLDLDDHRHTEVASRERVHLIHSQMTAPDNLEVQTRVLSRALAFVGTYGGFSYLAPHYDVPSFSFYSNGEGFLFHHLELARRAFLNTMAPFMVLDVLDRHLLQLSGILSTPPARALRAGGEPDGSSWQKYRVFPAVEEAPGT